MVYRSYLRKIIIKEKDNDARDTNHSIRPLCQLRRHALVEFAGNKRDVLILVNHDFASSHENDYSVSWETSFLLQSSNFTYDPKDLAEINHDVLYREGENIRVRMLGCQQLSSNTLLLIAII